MTAVVDEKQRSSILEYPEEYLEGIELFNRGDYFEAHETWESLWLVSTGEEKRFLQGLIQSAVALYHHERQRFGAARRTFERARQKLEGLPRLYMSLEIPEFLIQMERFFGCDILDAPSGGYSPSARPAIRLAEES